MGDEVMPVSRNHHGIVDKPLVLYLGVPNSISGSSSLSDETKSWPHPHITIAVGGALNINSLTHSCLSALRSYLR